MQLIRIPPPAALFQCQFFSTLWGINVTNERENNKKKGHKIFVYICAHVLFCSLAMHAVCFSNGYIGHSTIHGPI